MVEICERREVGENNQYGFRSKRSCADAKVSTTAFMTSGRDNDAPGRACFIDLQKAFDPLDHAIHQKNQEDTARENQYMKGLKVT